MMASVVRAKSSYGHIVKKNGPGVAASDTVAGHAGRAFRHDVAVSKMMEKYVYVK